MFPFSKSDSTQLRHWSITFFTICVFANCGTIMARVFREEDLNITRFITKAPSHSPRIKAADSSILTKCDSNRNPCKSGFVCSSSSGRCECSNGTVFLPQTESCWDVAKTLLNVCYHDIQCQAGKWGSLSRCNKQTAQCECYDQMLLGRRTVTLVDGVCYVQKFIGDGCTFDDQCKTIQGEAHCKREGLIYRRCRCVEETHVPSKVPSLNVCLPLAKKPGDKCVMEEQCQNGPLGKLSHCLLEDDDGGTCACSDTSLYNSKLGSCARKKEYMANCAEGDECRQSLGERADCIKSMCLPMAAKFGDVCITQEQCRRGSLGNLSRCIGGQCQCHSGEEENDEETFYHYHPRLHRCFRRKQYNESCSDNDECEASLGPRVICGYPEYHSDIDAGRICYCPTGKVCRSISIGFAVRAGTVTNVFGIMLLFIFLLYE